VFTCFPGVHQEGGVGEGAPRHQALSVGLDAAGVPYLRLHHQDGEGAVGDVTPLLQDADPVLAHLPGDERDACRRATLILYLKIINHPCSYAPLFTDSAVNKCLYYT
jgi:hypothetical protein